MLPAFPIVDTHLHVWDPGLLDYPWLDDVPALNRPFLLDDYRSAVEPVEVERMVFVQCEAAFDQFREEAAWVERLAARDPRVQGIVPWAPLERGAAAADDLAALAANPRVKGIRRIIQFEDDPEFCLRPDFVEGVQALAAFDLHFELCLKGDAQFRNAITLVQACPNVRFILNHIGKPFIAEGVFEPWATLMRELAALPNAWCKISGLANEADMEAWTSDDLRPYIEHSIAAFGWDRVVFGGDWPVATLATTYPRWVETLAAAVADAPPEHRRALFHDNAVRFYRLDD